MLISFNIELRAVLACLKWFMVGDVGRFYSVGCHWDDVRLVECHSDNFRLVDVRLIEWHLYRSYQ